MSKRPTIDIVIVNWNSGSQLRQCLASIPTAADPSVAIGRIVVVDNASSDDSATELAAPGLPIELIRNSTNGGFAAACNFGAHGSAADYLLFLNPDTRLFADSLRVPIAYMDAPENGRIGIVGIQLLDDSNAVQRSCARFPTPARMIAQSVGLDRLFPNLSASHFMREWDHRSTRMVDQVMGAFFLTRRPLFESLGGFDDRFFVYYEDVDFALRAHAVGWRSCYLASACAYHRGGGTSDAIPARRLFYALRSRLLFAFKHFGPSGRVGVAVATLLAEPVARLVRALLLRSSRELAATLAGYALLVVYGAAHFRVSPATSRH